jgi:hypothetical protein
MKERCHACFELQQSTAIAPSAVTTAEAAQSDSRTVALSLCMNEPTDTLTEVSTWGAPVGGYSGAGRKMKEPQK